MTEETDSNSEGIEKAQQQQRLAYKLEDILSDPELADAIGNILVQMCLPSLERDRLITRRHATDLRQVYDRTITSMLTPEQLEAAEKEKVFQEWVDEQRRAKGLPPKKRAVD